MRMMFKAKIIMKTIRRIIRTSRVNSGKCLHIILKHNRLRKNKISLFSSM
jgi:hypothetical protein